MDQQELEEVVVEASYVCEPWKILICLASLRDCASRHNAIRSAITDLRGEGLIPADTSASYAAMHATIEDTISILQSVA